MTKKLKELTTARAIVAVLGGDAIVAKVIGVTSKAVNNWVNWNRFPAATYARMLWELNKLGYTAPPGLWRQLGTEKLRIRRITK